MLTELMGLMLFLLFIVVFYIVVSILSYKFELSNSIIKTTATSLDSDKIYGIKYKHGLFTYKLYTIEPSENESVYLIEHTKYNNSKDVEVSVYTKTGIEIARIKLNKVKAISYVAKETEKEVYFDPEPLDDTDTNHIA